MPALPDQANRAIDIAAAATRIFYDEARDVAGVQLPVNLGRINR
ncbi:hypothetical protein TEK04_05065 [Klenkia sp. LSe6-5]|uniref:Uncharacterized protein n=1 Tax=Klenkia sesuvii TaxID=3103137 RepID=A0ABU8DST1_9ACTN